MEFDYASRLYSGEFNLRHPIGQNVTMFGGFRWVELEENLTGQNPANTFITVDTNNHLYGVQLGADATLWAPGALGYASRARQGRHLRGPCQPKHQ